MVLFRVFKTIKNEGRYKYGKIESVIVGTRVYFVPYMYYLKAGKYNHFKIHIFKITRFDQVCLDLYQVLNTCNYIFLKPLLSAILF